MAIYTTQQCLQSLVESSSHKYSSFVSNPKYKPITLKGLLYHTARVNIIFAYKDKSESPNKQQYVILNGLRIIGAIFVLR